MGAIKDIVDLTKDLESRAKERRDMEVIHKIQALAFSFQSSYADVIERDVRLMEENAELKRQLADAQSEEVRVHSSGVEFRRGKRTGGKWLPFCPVCHDPAAAASQADNSQFRCQSRTCGVFLQLYRSDLQRVIAELGV